MRRLSFSFLPLVAAPQTTPHFTLTGTAVTGNGITAAGQVDYFYGQDGVAYSVTIASGANLFTTFDNSASSDHNGLYGTSLLTSSGAPNHEVVYMTAGNFVNDGTLNTYPVHLGDAAYNYHQTSAVVYINNTKTTPSQVTNAGTIGDVDYISNRSDPHYSYAQENTAGIVLNNGTITNEAGGVITGYNAVFTFGVGVLNNYGRITAVNDGALTGFVLNNYANASLSTTNAGFACTHSYNTVNNWGYMLGNDYGILLTGTNLAINDYGGAVVPGVHNFNGAPVYNGEISSLIRGSEMPNTQGPFQGADAIMLSGSHQTVNLYSQITNGSLFLPVIVGPMEGGFNGYFGGTTASGQNTLNFAFNGLSVDQAQGLQNAIAASYTSGPHGHYYSGSYTLAGITYQWEDFAMVDYSGKAVSGMTPTPTAKPTSTGTSIATAQAGPVSPTSGASTTTAPSTSHGLALIGPLIGFLLALLVLLAGYLILRRQRSLAKPRQPAATNWDAEHKGDTVAHYPSSLWQNWDDED